MVDGSKQARSIDDIQIGSDQIRRNEGEREQTRTRVSRVLYRFGNHMRTSPAREML